MATFPLREGKENNAPEIVIDVCGVPLKVGRAHLAGSSPAKLATLKQTLLPTAPQGIQLEWL